MNLRQAVVFAIFMQNGEGIKTKSPDYLKEKLQSCKGSERPELLLDDKNLKKFKDWQDLWNVKFE